MDAQVKAGWVAALRSGEYEQGTGSLRNSCGKYCCLGVLCELAVKAGIIPPPELILDSGNYAYGEEKNVGYLPFKVRAWAGLDSMNPAVCGPSGAVYGDGRYGLAGHNDMGESFNQIADLIEQDL